MKLFFCDICNESIPLQDIKENRATTIKGKIFCTKCNPLNELAGGPSTPAGGAARTAGGGRAAPMLLGALVVLLLVVVLGGGYLALAEREAERRGPLPSTDGGERVAALERRVGELAARAEGAAGDGAAAATGEVVALREELAARAADLARVEGLVTKLQGTLQGMGDVREKVEKLGLRQAENTQKLAALAAAVDGFGRALEDVAARQPLAGGPPAEGPRDDAPAKDPATPAAPDPEVVELIEKLNSKAPLERWDAVDRVRRRKDPALIPHVIPILDDRDPLVRAQAAYALGELRASAAVPKLVKLLEDDEISIREEAQNSLILITGENSLRYAVDGSRDERSKGIRRWQDWLAKNKPAGG